ncbi:hypothetical protein HCJ66_05570 [Listeria sp. FSL L7-1582]|nr:hypothetical protein [Listeria portnoyi]
MAFTNYIYDISVIPAYHNFLHLT